MSEQIFFRLHSRPYLLQNHSLTSQVLRGLDRSCVHCKQTLHAGYRLTTDLMNFLKLLFALPATLGEVDADAELLSSLPLL